MEYYKVYCQDHQYEPVTNFCTDPQCLIGLCATCICEHTRTHMARGSSPSYQNIKNTYSRYNARMKEQIDLIEQDKTWLNNICHNIGEKRQQVKDTLKKARQDCLNLVNKHFDELQTKISSQILNETKKNSLHSSYRLQTINTLMLKEVSNLLLFSKDLSSSNFLETAKIVEEEVFPNSSQFHLKVCKELKENEVYTASAIYREEFLGELAHSLKRMVNLQFLLPRVEYVDGPARQERADKLDDIRRSSSMKRNNSSVIVNPRISNYSPSRNVSTLIPKNSTSIVLNGSYYNPMSTLQQFAVNRSEVSSPTLSKSSRLSNNFGGNLKVIRETKRQSTTQLDNRSLTASSVSCTNKENDMLAHSTYFDSGSNFYK